MLRIETGLLLLSLLVAFAYPQLGSRWFERWENRFSALSRHRALSVVLVGLIALGLRAAVLPIEPIPEPIVHDEFGYLLAADTFAHGRLTNPTPPMWEHFETFHAMFQPTYASIYPAAQGLLLAAGKLIFGHPFWGVWLSVGLMCVAITWMLQGWLPPEWALLGGFLAVLRYGVFGYWTNSYWGGAPATIGGALVLGSLPRIRETQRVRDALLMGLGLAILANSRPYEGFVFSLPIGVVLFAWMLSTHSPPFPVCLRRVVVPLTLVLGVTALGMGYYFWRITANPLRMPYQVERQTYAVAPYMIWQPLRPEPQYRHAAIKKMYVEEETLGRKVFSSPIGTLLRTYLAWSFFLGPALTLPLLFLFLTLPRNFSLRRVSRSTWTLLAIFAVSAVGSVLVNFYSAHYSAPATGLFLALVLVAMMQLRRWGRAGLFLNRAIPTICCLSILVRAAASPLHVPLREFFENAWYQQGPHSYGRGEIVRELQRMPGKQLVIVHYKPEHEPFAEWVYNEADIDGEKIVWARDMGTAENEALMRHFANRDVWIISADDVPPKIERAGSFTGDVRIPLNQKDAASD